MNSQMDAFLRAVSSIQKETVVIALINKEKYSSTEELLLDATYEMTTGIMELIDGYYNRNLKYRVTEINSNEVVNDDIEFHDLTESYMKYTDK